MTAVILLSPHFGGRFGSYCAVSRAAAFVATALFTLASIDTVVADAPPTIEAIRRHWESRQNQVKSLRLAWRDKRIFKVTRRGPVWHGDPASPGGYATVGYDERVKIAGDMIDHQSDCTAAAEHNESSFVRRAYNGKKSQFFCNNTDETKSGILTGAPYSDTSQSLPLFPIYWAFRPLHAQMGAIDLGRTTVLPEEGLLDGDACVILRTPINNRSNRDIWVNPALHYLPVRLLQTVDGNPQIKMDVWYSQHTEIGPVPRAWTMTWLGANGALFDSNEAVVSACSVNCEIAASDFDIVFPNGTNVIDNVSGTRYVVGATNRDASRERSAWPWRFGATLLACLIFLFIWRAARRSKSPLLKAPVE